MEGGMCALAAYHRKRLRDYFCEPLPLNADGCTTRSGSPEGACHHLATGQARARSSCNRVRPFMSASAHAPPRTHRQSTRTSRSWHLQ
eukprot:3938527-Prorocentrum_lima.AAC.1